MVRLSASGDGRSRALTSAARIVPPWATATMSRPRWAADSRSTAAPTRLRRSLKLSPFGGAVSRTDSQKP